MPRIDITKVAVAAGVGIADEVAEFLDRNRGNTRPFVNFTDWYRLLVTAGGALLTTSNLWPAIGETSTYSGTPLVIKSISRLVREGFAPGVYRSRNVPSMQARRALMPGTPAAVERSRQGEEILLTVV